LFLFALLARDRHGPVNRIGIDYSDCTGEKQRRRGTNRGASFLA